MNSLALRDIARRLPILRSALHSAPQYHVGSVLENRLGLQVLRVVSKQLGRSFRSDRSSEEIRPFAEALERDGIVILPDFLEENKFEAVVSEFDEASAAVPLAAYKNAASARLHRKQIKVSDSPDDFPVIHSVFRQNRLLDGIVSAAIRRPVTKRPEILLDTYQCLDRDLEDNDIENILHADLHVPTIKMFFYLTDTNEENGAFVYAKGSHKLSFARLRHEYDLSVREAKLDRQMPVEPALLERRASEARNIIRPEHRRRMKVVETQVCVKANTLVIANNMGFHRRGEFSSDRPRKALRINYRKAEPAIW
jgi:hypothetical protein